MSYNGYTVVIGKCKHSWKVDYNLQAGVRILAIMHCPVCGRVAEYKAEVDTTNGYGIEYGCNAVDPEMFYIGLKDQWKYDHYGNNYAVQHRTFSPKGTRWKKVKDML